MRQEFTAANLLKLQDRQRQVGMWSILNRHMSRWYDIIERILLPGQVPGLWAAFGFTDTVTQMADISLLRSD